MYVFFAIAAFILLNRLHKFIKVSPLWLKWGKILSYAQVGVWVVFGLTSFLFDDFDYSDALNMLLESGMLFAVVWYVSKEDDFKGFKPFVLAHYPLIAIGFIVGIMMFIVPKFVHEHENYFQFAVVGGFLWTIARWAMSKKQLEEFKIVTQKNNELDQLVAVRTAELTQKNAELEKTLEQLQTTQEQLIQSEKLASLGELTAGIAHEIQNPLNFVNNFSEVNMELIEEMETELTNGDKDEAMAIAADIKQNLEKIRHHGQRADGIVKGMLQHSRASSNTKEPTDINKLADEYLRLAYHGLRAKDKSFNADLETDLAPNIPMVNMVPQDVGRVLLNMFNNAFYAVQQKQKKNDASYKPIVKLSTAVNGKSLMIKVTDNGMGMPEHIKEKIMQPFFTTKPTGEGTGLGLSLSYDIIVKGHGGEIDVDSKENDHTIFTITLPL